MIKLTKQVNALENILEQLQEKIENLEDKQAEIEAQADEHDREMTSREQKRYDKLLEKIEELENEQSDIEYALGYLREYADE